MTRLWEAIKRRLRPYEDEVLLFALWLWAAAWLAPLWIR